MVNNWKLKCQHHGLQVHCKRLEVLKKEHYGVLLISLPVVILEKVSVFGDQRSNNSFFSPKRK